QLLEKQTYENRVSASKPRIKREVDSNTYSLGKNFNYRVIVEPDGDGYLNNYRLDESFQHLLVDTVDGKKELFLKNVEIKSNKNIAGSEIDLKAGESLIYEVKGSVNENTFGDIKYRELVIKSPEPKIVARVLNSSNYSPGRVYSYEVEVENVGEGNARDIPLEIDFEKNESKDWTEQKAFTFPNGKNIDEKIALKAHEKRTRKYFLKISDFLVGDIDLDIYVDKKIYKSTIKSESPELYLTKKIEQYSNQDRSRKIEGYTPEGYIEYFFKVENRGEGILRDYSFTPNIDGIKTESAHGDEILAFQSSYVDVIKVEKGEGTRLLPGGYIEYRVVGKVSKDAVGEIRKDEVVGKMAQSKVVHTFKSSKDIYKPGEVIEYFAILKNIGYGTAYLDSYRMKTGLSSSFQNSKDIVQKPVIYPGEEIVYRFIGVSKNNISENIKVDSEYGESFKTIEIKSFPGKLYFQNRLKSFNGKIVTSSSKYKPGDMITYEVSLKNFGEGFLKDVGIDANLDSVKAILSGSDVESASLENVDIAIKASDPRTVITSEMGDSRRWIKKRLKFAPKSSVTFSISGRISDRAVSSLSGMEFKVGDEVKTSDGIA
ncbi:MAG: hypothetical protein ACRDB7_05270, partial [Fusobacteriaceae bacterium]